MSSDKVTHFIITNRSVEKRGDKEYISKDGAESAGHNLRFGKMIFDPTKKISEVAGDHYELYPDPEVDQSDLTNPETGFTYDFAQDNKFGSTRLFEKLNEQGIKAGTRKKEHILVYIHGYKCDLNTAFETVRHLHNLYVENDDSPIQHIVLFTWPAKEKLLEYRDDAQDAIISGYALARTFKKLQRFFRHLAMQAKQDNGAEFCHQKIHLMCHSMGNRVLEAMFRELNNSQTKINSILGEILLIAADIDYNALEAPNPLYNLIELGERVHVYFHRHDKALGVSEWTKNAFNRLGRWGAKNTRNLPDDIIQANVTGIVEEDAPLFENVVNHWYYLNSRTVVKDIIEVFNEEVSGFAV